MSAGHKLRPHMPDVGEERIPAAAQRWNSDYLLPDQSFSVVYTELGVYDYFCIPHEHAGMVGRLVVAEEAGTVPAAPPGSPIKGIAADPFPPVKEIMRQGRVRPAPP
jgi:plastocyanin